MTKNGIIQFFSNPTDDISKLFYDLVDKLEISIPNCAEKSAGLRKLLEARDCFIRTKESK